MMKTSGAKSRSFTLLPVALTPIEQAVLSICRQAAAEGRPLESIEEISARIGVQGISTVPGIMKRLEAKGCITRNIYQRGRQVCIPETGQCTAAPSCTAPHWRFRTERVPTPAIHTIRERAKPVAAMIETEARLTGKALSEFLADLVYIGWHGYMAEKEAEA